jgi:predicted Zn-dependent protease with MMP-like domain
MTPAERREFDALLESLLDLLPPNLQRVLEEVPVVVLDRPTTAMLRSLGVPRDLWKEEAQTLCGLHTGTMLTERSIEHSAELPEDIHLFRDGIVEAAGGWEQGAERVREEIRITLLHEIGHHFGLDEDDLDKLGYG